MSQTRGRSEEKKNVHVIANRYQLGLVFTVCVCALAVHFLFCDGTKIYSYFPVYVYIEVKITSNLHKIAASVVGLQAAKKIKSIPIPNTPKKKISKNEKKILFEAVRVDLEIHFHSLWHFLLCSNSLRVYLS